MSDTTKKNTKTIKVKGESVTLTEESAKYLDALKSVISKVADIELSLRDMLESFQSEELPFKSEELEMENASIVIFTSTILSNLDKIKESSKHSASWIVKKSKS